MEDFSENIHLQALNRVLILVGTALAVLYAECLLFYLQFKLDVMMPKINYRSIFKQVIEYLAQIV